MLSKFGVLGLLSLSVVVGCSVSSPYNPNYKHPFKGALINNIDDRKALCIKISETLEDEGYNIDHIGVACDHYSVLIVGEVDSEVTKNKVAKLIKSIPSVKEYNDYLTINAKPALYIDRTAGDAAKARLDNQANISLENLKVAVVAGSAYIMGSIKTDQVKDLKYAIDGIYAIKGINRVVNLTKVTPYDTGDSFNN